MSRDWQKDMLMESNIKYTPPESKELPDIEELKKRLAAAQEEIARINCDYYADKQRFHDRGRELEEAKERADKAEEREKVLKHAFIVLLGYVPKTARVALDFDEVLASLYPKEETK